MKNRYLFCLLALVGVAFLFAGNQAYGGPKKKAKYVNKVATLAPDGTVWMKSMRMVADHVEEASGGEFRTKFFTGGVMGDEPDVVRKMKLGQLDGSGVSLTGVRLTCPEFQVLEMPFLFGGEASDMAQAYEEAEYILLTLYNEFDKYALEHGYRIVALGSAGFAHICSEKPLDNILNDFPRQKVWQWEGETVMKAISRSMGVPTISLPLPDTLTALQTGMINAFYGTCIHVLSFQWDRYVNYLYTPAVFYTPSFVVVTERAFKRTPEHINKFFFDEEAMRIKKETLRWIHDDDQEAKEVLRKGGTKIIQIPPDQLAQIKTRTRQVWKEMNGDLFPAELMEKVERLLAEYRAQKSASVESVEKAAKEP